MRHKIRAKFYIFIIYRLYKTTAKFVTKAWNNVKVRSVIKSFKKCGISNAMDGSEDNLLYESKDEAKVDLPEPDWNPCDDGICDKSRDVLEKCRI